MLRNRAQDEDWTRKPLIEAESAKTIQNQHPSSN